MKKLITIMLIFIISCKSQNNINQNNNNKMETFKIKEIKNKFKLNEDISEVKKNTEFIYSERDDIYRVTSKIKNSPFVNNKVFYKNSMSLKAEGNSFYMIPIGISIEYDETGNVIEEKNWDEFEGRTFSIQQLINKMNNDFNIDLTDVNRCGLNTEFDPRYGYYYVVMIRNFDSHGRPREIHINVKTGEVMSDEFITLKK